MEAEQPEESKRKLSDWGLLALCIVAIIVLAQFAVDFINDLKPMYDNAAGQVDVGQEGLTFVVSYGEW